METNEQKDIETALLAYGDRLHFRQRVAIVQAHTDMDAMREAAGLYSPGRVQSGQIRTLWRTYRTTLAVAASVAVLTTIGTLLSYRFYQQSHQQQEQQYSLLRRDIQAIKSSQKQLLSDLTGRSRALSMSTLR